MRLRCFLSSLCLILADPALPRSQRRRVPPLPALVLGNRQIFCYLHINIFIEFAFGFLSGRLQVRAVRGWRRARTGAAPTGVLFHPFACQKLCKYVYHFHLPTDLVHLALSKQPAQKNSSSAHIPIPGALAAQPPYRRTRVLR